MKWLELSTQVDREAVESVSELLTRLGHGGIVIEENVISYNDREGYELDHSKPVTVKTYLPVDDKINETTKQIEEGLWRLSLLRPISALQAREMAEEDWANAWKAHFQVHKIGNRTVIKPSWLEYVSSPGEIVIEIDPGMAFGTGLHPTTRMCLRAIEEHVTAGANILDLGTGSGILAIAAAKVGARSILALDIDSVAAETAAKNIELNGLQDIVTVEQGTLGPIPEDADSLPSVFLHFPFDVVIANIIASVIIDLASPMNAVLKPGGILISSGIIDTRLEEVQQSLAEAGFDRFEILSEGDWRSIVCRKNN